MESLKKNKILVGLLIISFAAFLFYQFGGVFGSKDDSAFADEAVEENLSQEILLLLNQMQQARIDENLFTSTAWTSLVDYSIVLPNDIPGRSDLFGGSLQSNNTATSPTPPISTTTKTTPASTVRR